MAYHGKYGDLGTVDAAVLTLKDMANELKPEDLEGVDDPRRTPGERYSIMRLLRQIEGLQMVIWLNGGTEPATWLPNLFKKEQRKYYAK